MGLSLWLEVAFRPNAPPLSPLRGEGARWTRAVPSTPFSALAAAGTRCQGGRTRQKMAEFQRQRTVPPSPLNGVRAGVRGETVRLVHEDYEGSSIDPLWVGPSVAGEVQLSTEHVSAISPLTPALSPLRGEGAGLAGTVPGTPPSAPVAAWSRRCAADLRDPCTVAQIINLSVSPKIVAGGDDFPTETERRLAVGFWGANTQSRLQAGAPFWLRLGRAALYRGFAIGRASGDASTLARSGVRRVECCDTADCKSGLPVCGDALKRHSPKPSSSAFALATRERAGVRGEAVPGTSLGGQCPSAEAQSERLTPRSFPAPIVPIAFMPPCLGKSNGAEERMGRSPSRRSAAVLSRSRCDR
jgi:hypothetical protein